MTQNTEKDLFASLVEAQKDNKEDNFYNLLIQEINRKIQEKKEDTNDTE